jgi:site-specific recombinase XerD
MKPRSIEARFMSSALAQKNASTLTKERMKTTFVALAKHCKTGRYGDVSPEKITEKQIRKFVESRLATGISARSLQNEMSHIRRSLNGARRDDFANAITNDSLGIPSGSRIGVATPVNEHVFAQAMTNADPTTQAWIKLERYLGLRQSEMIESGKSLAIWQQSLESGRGFIAVRDGTKGGRPRETYIAPEHRERALDAIKSGLEALKNGRIVDASSKVSARQQVHDRFSGVGLSGQNSGHTLRRAFALDQYRHYLKEGHDQKQALSLCSRDLGHGEGRGRWVFNNYIRGAVDD